MSISSTHIEGVQESFCRARNVVVKNTFLSVECKPFDLGNHAKIRSRSWSSDGDGGERPELCDSSASPRRVPLSSESIPMMKAEHRRAKFTSASKVAPSSLSTRRALAQVGEGAEGNLNVVVKNTFLELKSRPEDSNDARHRSRSWSSEGSDDGAWHCPALLGLVQTDLKRDGNSAGESMSHGEVCGEPRASAAAKRLESAKALLATAQDEARLAMNEVSAIRIYQDPNVDLTSCTTIMLRSLHKRTTRAMLLTVLLSEGFAGLYDFVCLPLDFRRNTAFGYAFVNFTFPEAAHRAMCCFSGFSRWPVAGSRASAAVWSSPLQGLEALIARFQNSPVMHDSVPEEHRPLIFDRSGATIPFPPPERRIRMPRCSREFPAQKAQGN